MRGFKIEQSTSLVVDAGNTIPLDFKLQIGSNTETVEVSATEELVNTALLTTDNSSTRRSSRILPNPGRNPFLFSKLDNNVTPVGDPRFVRFQTRADHPRSPSLARR